MSPERIRSGGIAPGGDGISRRMKPIVRTARDAANLCEPHLGGSAEETLVVLHLDSQRRLLRLWVETVEGVSEGALPVRSIIADAVRHDSAGLVMAHRHPGGDLSPSAGDIAATRKLAEAAALLDIKLHDRLVFAGGECASFRRLGLI